MSLRTARLKGKVDLDEHSLIQDGALEGKEGGVGENRGEDRGVVILAFVVQMVNAATKCFFLENSAYGKQTHLCLSKPEMLTCGSPKMRFV